MNREFVHFDAKSGEIRQVSSSGAPFEVPGCEIAEMGVSHTRVDATKWRVDIKSLRKRDGDVMSCRLVEIV